MVSHSCHSASVRSVVVTHPSFVILLFLTAVAVFCLPPTAANNLPQVDASSLLPLTQDKLQLISYALELANAAYTRKKALAMEGVTFYGNDKGIDAVLTAEPNDDYCFVAFRGSRSLLSAPSIQNLQDWFGQNFDFQPVEVSDRTEATDDQCTVQRGYYDGYVGQYYDRVNDFIDTCMKETSNQKKQLVLTGHSQGGAIAGVAAILNAKYKPLTITFGQPQFLKTSSCSLLQSNRVWRIINTENARSGIQYDPVSYNQLVGLSNLELTK